MEVRHPSPASDHTDVDQYLVTNEGEVILNDDTYDNLNYSNISRYHGRVKLEGLRHILSANMITDVHEGDTLFLLNIDGEVSVLNQSEYYVLQSGPIKRMWGNLHHVYVLDREDNLHQLIHINETKYGLSPRKIPNVRLFQIGRWNGMVAVDRDNVLHLFGGYNLGRVERLLQLDFQVKWILYYLDHPYVVDYDHNVWAVKGGTITQVLTLSLDVEYATMILPRTITTIDVQGRLIHYNLSGNYHIHIEGTYTGLYHIRGASNLVLEDGLPKLYMEDGVLGEKYDLPFPLLNLDRYLLRTTYRLKSAMSTAY